MKEIITKFCFYTHMKNYTDFNRYFLSPSYSLILKYFYVALEFKLILYSCIKSTKQCL